VQEGIAGTAARREMELAEGRLAIIGVTAFSASEMPFEIAPHPAPAPIERAESRVPAMPVRRLSARFETKETTT